MNWKNIRLGSAKSNLTGYLNVNSLGNKYVSIEELVKSNIDTLLLSDSKLDETFPNKQLEIQGYKTFGKDRNKHRGGVMLHVNENIPCRVLDIDSIVMIWKLHYWNFPLRFENGYVLVCTNLLIKMSDILLKLSSQLHSMLVNFNVTTKIGILTLSWAVLI